MEKKIVVVMGGVSTEAEISRKTGNAVYYALKHKGYNVEKMEFNPLDFVNKIAESKCSIVFNAMHGKYGEDGVLQGILDMLKIPYTGSGVLASAVTMNKASTKRYFRSEGIPTPKFHVYYKKDKRDEIVNSIVKEFNFPMVVKSPSQGSSIGVYIVASRDELIDAIENAFKYDDEIMVEEFVKGKELTVAVWGNENWSEAFPIIEIATVSGKYDYSSKYTKGASAHIIPARIPKDVENQIRELAIKTFETCGCKGVARMDIMLSDMGKPYVIEVNSVPGMTELSLVPDAGRHMGIEFPELCEKILELAGFKKE